MILLNSKFAPRLQKGQSLFAITMLVNLKQACLTSEFRFRTPMWDQRLPAPVSRGWWPVPAPLPSAGLPGPLPRSRACQGREVRAPTAYKTRSAAPGEGPVWHKPQPRPRPGEKSAGSLKEPETVPKEKDGHRRRSTNIHQPVWPSSAIPEIRS